MELGSIAPGKSQVMGIRRLLAQGQRIVDSLQGLVWVAQQPQEKTCMIQATNRVSPMDEGPRAVLLKVIKGFLLLQVCLGSGQISKPEQDMAHGKITPRKQHGILLALGPAEELLCQLARLLKLPL